jgi:hypothetical protein
MRKLIFRDFLGAINTRKHGFPSLFLEISLRTIYLENIEEILKKNEGNI